MRQLELNQKEFHVLSELLLGEKAGREIHISLCTDVGLISGPGFYKMMGKLRTLELVQYRTEKVEVNGHKVREHRYEITAAGKEIFDETALYYASKGGLVNA